MSYRAGSNALLGPGAAMLAALGGASSSYHLFKMLQWRRYKQYRFEKRLWWPESGGGSETEGVDVGDVGD